MLNCALNTPNTAYLHMDNPDGVLLRRMFAARVAELQTGDSRVAQAREACGVVVDMIRAKKMAGRALLLTGAMARCICSSYA